MGQQALQLCALSLFGERGTTSQLFLLIRATEDSQLERQITTKTQPSASAPTVANARPSSHPTLALNSRLPATQDSLKILAPRPRIWLPCLLHLCQPSNGRQGHSLRLGPSPATKELSVACSEPSDPGPSSQPSAASHSAGSFRPPPHLAPRPPQPRGVHFPRFRLQSFLGIC